MIGKLSQIGGHYEKKMIKWFQYVHIEICTEK